MKFLKTLFLATILSVAANAAETSCPAGWLPNTFKQTRCCSGNMVIDEEGAYCCVYDMRAYKEALTNTAKVYATPTTKEGETNWSTVHDSCVVKVRFTASDYSAQVSSAASKAESTPTTTSAGEVTSTSTTQSGISSGTGSGSGSQTSTPTPTSNGAMPLATEAMLGSAAFAAALYLL
ncbi:hypothetical protein PHISCL_03746 [Aspergillus sclerotialis]|uniref:Uncharacterized protein n=1 Tax=Aspergillus sclerotialis TaxID=2070753 RepID=A0A3A2ZMU6_9EURO|nr:hypothetical protein PHISCL_03746 [Aspergillus sclerotialis]